ncbi:MAG: hypothetical protein NDI69_07170 [Bacteriovoracaceae bacterium]|nr:hypothetical protein [Bacteriovoracaceae bacterium]
MNLINFFFIALFSFSVLALTEEEEKRYDELEGLPFLHALIVDKKHHEVIKQFSSIEKNKDQLGQYYYYLSEAHFSLKNYQKAFTALEQGSKFKNLPGDYYKLWARTASALKKHSICSELYLKSGLNNIVGADWDTFADCLNKSGQVDKLLGVLLNHQSEDMDYFLVGQKYLIRKGLVSFADNLRQKFLSTCAEPGTYLKLWETLEAEKIRDIKVLETAHACHPKAIELTGLLVKNLFLEGKYHSIAHIFENLSLQDPTYLKHAAEFYKVAGRQVIADYYFIFGDENEFLLSKSAKFLTQENYAGLLTVPLKHEMILQNKDLAYAIAYSQFKYFDLDASRSTLFTQVKRNSRDQQLERLIEQCRTLQWKCRP